MTIAIIILISISILLSIFSIYHLAIKKDDKGSIYLDVIRGHLDSQKTSLNSEISSLRKEANEQDINIRKEIRTLFSEFNSSNIRAITEISKKSSEQNDPLRDTVDLSLKNMQQSNEKKLDDMRKTVDEKLSETLEKRITSSFERVSKDLENVYKSMGEVKQLADGFGEMKNVLTNVKARGGWGEVQLEILIEDMLTRNQFEKNYRVGTGTVVFAVKMPGRKDNPVYLPIDSKFPMEDYSRLIEAQKAGNVALMDQSRKKLRARFKEEGKKISQKYIDPPQTTEFAIMFLPVEGLYAEAIQGGLLEDLQNNHKVVITGPSTLSALLSSLQMGFRTLEIEKKSIEVWNTLSAIKKGFSNFSVVLEKAKNTLSTAQRHLDDASTKTRTIETKLRKVELLDDGDDTDD